LDGSLLNQISELNPAKSIQESEKLNSLFQSPSSLQTILLNFDSFEKIRKCPLYSSSAATSPNSLFHFKIT